LWQAHKNEAEKSHKLVINKEQKELSVGKNVTKPSIETFKLLRSKKLYSSRFMSAKKKTSFQSVVMKNFFSSSFILQVVF
jgi:hypothetical protein